MGPQGVRAPLAESGRSAGRSLFARDFRPPSALLAFALAASARASVGCAPLHDPHSISTEAVRVVPLRSLQLFETGVGYFERVGIVDGETLTGLPVPASHLDDALKSLVIVSAHGGPTIAALEFGSSLSSGMARAQAGLPLDASAPITYRDLLKSVQGEPVEIVSKTGRVVGRLVDVLDAPAPGKAAVGATAATTDDALIASLDPTLILLVVTDAGAIMRIATRDVLSVRPLDAAFPGRIAASLDSLGTRSAQVRRIVKLLGTGKGEVTFGYIAETPLWRPSYRLVLDAAGQSAALQGWALIHNDTDEDWRRVSVKLVNGQPDSFLFPLAAPRYFKRPLVHPEHELSTVPQLMARTPDAIWGDHTDETGESYGMGSIGLSGEGDGGGGGGASHSYGGGHASGSAVSGSSLLDVGDLASLALGTEGVEAGSLFHYALGHTMDLGAHSSALVPFLSQNVDAEVVTWFASTSDAPRSTVRFTNSTTQTLPAGTVALYAASDTLGTGGFVGESAIPRLKPAEHRFVQYGADLDLDLAVKQLSRDDVTKRVVFAHGALQQHYLSTIVSQWTFDNRSATPRRAFVLLSLRSNATITGADALDYDTAAGQPVAIVAAKQRAKTAKNITTIEALQESIPLDELRPSTLESLRDKPGIPPEEKAVLGDAVARAGEFAAAKTAREKLVAEAALVEKDLARLRDDLKATSGTGASLGDRSSATNPFVVRILAAEDRLVLTRKAIEAADADLVARRQALRKTLERLAPKP